MEFSSKFFENRQCKFFPCHDLQGDFNCLFCYCPLYFREVCPGNPTFIKKENGLLIKRCTDCTFPHRPENYERIMNLLRASKTEIDFTEYHHGDECFEQNHGEGSFSVNTNPLGLPESVKIAIQNSIPDFEFYPDQNCTHLRKKLAKNFSSSLKVKIFEENIICGNGASELIQLVTQSVLPKNALIVSPAFSGYEKALKICYSKIHHHILAEKNGFLLDETVFDSIEKTQSDMVFLCSPNNPTGKMVEFSLLKKLIEFCEDRGLFLFVDECFIDFTERTAESAVQFIGENPHLIVLNAFTKIYAMAGLRLGYILTSNQQILQKVNFLKPEWNVSKIAQIAGGAALSESNIQYLNETRNLIKTERDYLSKELKALGFSVYTGDANFILFKNNLKMSEKLDKILSNQGIFLRNCSNFTGLDEKYWRTAVRTHKENISLIDALKNLL